MFSSLENYFLNNYGHNCKKFYAITTYLLAFFICSLQQNYSKIIEHIYMCVTE